MVGRPGLRDRLLRRAPVDRPLRVVHLLHRLSTDGGVQVVVRTLAAAVDPREIELHVVTARSWIAADELDRVPARIHALGAVDWEARPFDRFRVMVQAARTVLSIRPDVVQLHSGMAWMGYLARLVAPRAAFVVEVHDAPGSGRHGELTDRLEGLWSRYLGAVAVCHSSSVEHEVRSRWRLAEDRVVTLPLAVDTARFVRLTDQERAAWRREHGLAEDEVVVIAAGRLVPSKRMVLAVGAIARLRSEGRPVSLVLVGRGVQELLLQALSVELGMAEHVLMAGFVDDDEFARLMGIADIMCSPSAYEGFGLTLVEGMAAELPVVAVDVGGVPDVVDDEVTGVLVPGGQPDHLVEPLRQLVDDPESRRRMGRAARERATSVFGIERFAGAFTAVYRSVAGLAPSGRRSGSAVVHGGPSCSS